MTTDQHCERAIDAAIIVLMTLARAEPNATVAAVLQNRLETLRLIIGRGGAVTPCDQDVALITSRIIAERAIERVWPAVSTPRNTRTSGTGSGGNGSGPDRRRLGRRGRGSPIAAPSYARRSSAFSEAP